MAQFGVNQGQGAPFYMPQMGGPGPTIDTSVRPGHFPIYTPPQGGGMGPGQAIGGLLGALMEGKNKEGEKKSPGFIAQKVGERAVDEGRKAFGRMSFDSPYAIGQTLYNLDKHIVNAPGNLVDRFFDPFRANPEQQAQAPGQPGQPGQLTQPELDVEMSTKLPRGARNNNPGNIKHGNDWQGESKGTDLTFETFKSPEYGVRATAKLLRNYQRVHGLNTVRGIINRWAPSGVDNNSTSNYINSVAGWVGVDPDTKMDLNNAATLSALTAAMARYENGGDFFSRDVIERGVQMALGRRGRGVQ